MTIAELYRRASNVNLSNLVADILTENEQEITQINKDQLYKKSEDSEGERLDPYNSITYALMKSQRNPSLPFGAPDLYDTGDFYRGFFLEVTKENYKFGSSDEKSSMLMEKYGNNIFGLSSPSKTTLVQEILFPELSERINIITGLIFK